MRQSVSHTASSRAPTAGTYPATVAINRGQTDVLNNTRASVNISVRTSSAAAQPGQQNCADPPIEMEGDSSIDKVLV